MGNTTQTRRSQFRQRLALLAGVGVLALGAFASVLATQRLGTDFATLHLTAVGVATADPIYDLGWQRAAFHTRYGLGYPPGMFYPPATGVALLPFAFLPYKLGQWIWFALLTAAVVLGIRAVVRHGKPQGSAAIWTGLGGAALLTAVVRWGITPLQGAPLILGALFFFVLALHSGRDKLAFVIAAYVAAFKITLALPFFGLLVLHRRHATWVGALALAVGANVLAFARMGGMAIFRAYQANVALAEAVDDINTPNPWVTFSIPRLDWAYLFYGTTGNIALSRAVTLAASAAAGLWVLREMRRYGKSPDLATTSVFLLPLVCLSLLSVYHHHYDASLLIAPLAFIAAGSAQLRRPRWALGLVAPIVALMTFFPVRVVRDLLWRAFGERAVGLMNIAFPIAVTLALVGSLVLLRRHLEASRAVLVDQSDSGAGMRPVEVAT